MNNICYHPWVGLDISPQGQFKPCCKYQNTLADNLEQYQTSQELADVKEQFLAGARPTGCQRCWNDEDASLPSKRQIDWQYVFDNKKPDLNSLAILSFPFGNICNLACRICSSHSSSKWYDETRRLQKKIPNIPLFAPTRFYQNNKLLSSIKELSKNLIHIDFPGGEPFITGVDEQLEFLKFLVENNAKNISLHYTTNCTTFPRNEFWQLWKEFKHVDIQLSIDGIEQQFEYNRWPAVWTDALANIKQFQSKQHQETNLQLSISHSVSIFTVYYLPEFLAWCDAMHLPKPYLGIVARPVYYNIRALPSQVKDKIQEKLSSSLLENVVQYMNSEDLSSNFSDSIKWIDLLDEERSQDFKQVFLEFTKLLKETQCQH
jgi:organic radical activating enzyme